MSALVSIESLSIETRKRMISDLEVCPKVATGKDKYKPKDKFPVYDIVDDNLVAIPFAYFTHHLNMGFPNDKHFGHKLDTEFVGSLLQRQYLILQPCLDVLNDTRSLLISTATGYGKTIMAIYLACKIKYQTLIICHRTQIAKQWINTINKVCLDPIVQLITSTNEIDPMADFYIINTVNVSKRKRYDFFQCKTLVVDEAHTICTNKYSRALNFVFPKFMILLTATPNRDDDQDIILEMFGGPTMIYRPLTDLFNVYLIYTKFKPTIKQTERKELDWHSILESQVLDNDRNNLIVNICRFFTTRNILVLCKRKEHARILHQALKGFGEDVDIFVGNHKNVNYNSRILLVTYSKGGVGFDHPKMDTLLVAADVEDGYVQYLGRVFRKEYGWPCIIDLIDSFGPLIKHSKTRINICKQSGGQIKLFDKTFGREFRLWCDNFK